MKDIKVVTICGSMKFLEDMKRIARDLELEKGYVVIQCVYNEDNRKLSKEEIKLLSKLHFAKIDISDAIYVVNIGGYIGDSTDKEIEYAKLNSKQVIYHEDIK